MPRPAMRPAAEPDSLRALQEELERFIRTLAHPVVAEEDTEIFDLTVARWKLSIEFGKLLFEAWNPERSIACRVEEVAYRDRGRLGVFVRKPGLRATGTLEFRDFERARRAPRSATRSEFRQQFLRMLEREYSGWRFERVSHRSDREHSFSAWYTRGLARQGPTGWAFLGLGEAETPAAADAVVAFGLIWLDWLRARSDRATVPGLKLFLPRSATELTAHRSAFLNRRALQIEIFAWSPGEPHPAAVDFKDFGNVRTRLVPRRQGEALVERHAPTLRALLGEAFERVTIVPDPSGEGLSVRVLGLEVARIGGQLAPEITFGLEGNVRRLGEPDRAAFRELVSEVLELRRARPRDASHPTFRLQAERWLESLLVRDITKIDPELSPDCVYPQVPAFSGGDRGVIDILGATRRGRLAVIELKLDEEINLPIQGLDYWQRVRGLHERGEFRRLGYFTGLELSPAPPRLYLVSPAFRFHSTIERMVPYLDPAIEVLQVGLNDAWREGVKVLFRREMRRGPRQPQI